MELEDLRNSGALIAHHILAPTDDGAPGAQWLHLCAHNAASRRFLLEEVGLRPASVDAMLSEESRPRAVVDGTQLLLALRCPAAVAGDEADLVSLRVWTDGDLIVTARRRDSLAMTRLEEAFDRGRKKITSAGELLCALIANVTMDVLELVETLEDRIENIEEGFALGQAQTVCHKLVGVRLPTARLRRYMYPQERAVLFLLGSHLPWLSEKVTEEIRETHDKILVTIEALRDVSERGVILIDELARLHDTELNDSAYLFSVAAAIFLPLSFFTGLLGVNVGGIPGVNTPYGFLVVTILCVLTGVALLAIFRRRGLLKKPAAIPVLQSDSGGRSP